MKKFYGLTVTLLFTVLAFGQLDVGIIAGPQATGARYTILNQQQKNEIKYGFLAGVSFKAPFEENLFFSPTFFYSMKGYNVKFTKFAYPPDVNAKDNNTTIHSVELAALLQFDFTKKPNHVFIKAGPSLDFLLFGKESFNLMNGNKVSRNMPFSNGDYGHFSANLLGQIGYETRKGFLIYAQYTHGMASTSNADDGPKIRNRALSLVFGKYLKKKSK